MSGKHYHILSIKCDGVPGTHRGGCCGRIQYHGDDLADALKIARAEGWIVKMDGDKVGRVYCPNRVKD